MECETDITCVPWSSTRARERARGQTGGLYYSRRQSLRTRLDLGDDFVRREHETLDKNRRREDERERDEVGPNGSRLAEARQPGCKRATRPVGALGNFLFGCLMCRLDSDVFLTVRGRRAARKRLAGGRG